MPLQNGDVEVLAISNRSYKAPGYGQPIPVKEIQIRVRGFQDVLYIPLHEYTKETAEQAILRKAADTVDLLERFPAQG